MIIQKQNRNMQNTCDLSIQKMSIKCGYDTMKDWYLEEISSKLLDDDCVGGSLLSDL